MTLASGKTCAVARSSPGRGTVSYADGYGVCGRSNLRRAKADTGVEPVPRPDPTEDGQVPFGGENEPSWGLRLTHPPLGGPGPRRLEGQDPAGPVARSRPRHALKPPVHLALNTGIAAHRGGRKGGRCSPPGRLLDPDTGLDRLGGRRRSDLRPAQRPRSEPAAKLGRGTGRRDGPRGVGPPRGEVMNRAEGSEVDRSGSSARLGRAAPGLRHEHRASYETVVDHGDEALRSQLATWKPRAVRRSSARRGRSPAQI
jgi:hypothetical protein